MRALDAAGRFGVQSIVLPRSGRMQANDATQVPDQRVGTCRSGFLPLHMILKRIHIDVACGCLSISSEDADPIAAIISPRQPAGIPNRFPLSPVVAVEESVVTIHLPTRAKIDRGTIQGSADGANAVRFVKDSATVACLDNLN